jgi:hypothetical protein
MTPESVCKFNKFGFCKFGNYCFRNHENRICVNEECQVHGCPFSHPRKCRYFMEFRYSKFGSYCKFSHQTLRILETSKEIVKNPNSTNNSIELNLMLDYILTPRFTTPPTTTNSQFEETKWIDRSRSCPNFSVPSVETLYYVFPAEL